MSGRGFRRPEWTYCVLLALVTSKVYGEVLTSGFIRFDDPRYITQNAHVVAGLTWDGTVWAFTTLFKSNWHPLTWLSHMLDVELYGLNAGGHHATNLLIHAVNSVLLFAVLRSATRSATPSAIVAALFALHPTHVESVAWIAERKDVLSTFFGFLATAAYVGYARHGGALRYLATAGLLVLSLASKAMLVTLPFVFLLLDYWPLGRLQSERSARRAVLEKLPLLAVVAVISGLAYVAQAGTGAVGLGDAVEFHQRVANAVMSYGLYVWKTLWPSDLALVYPHPYLPGGVPWRMWEIAVTTVGLAAVTLASLLASRRPYLLVGWLWFVGTLVPVIGLVQAGTQGMADRYSYFPCIGLYIMGVWGGVDWIRARSRNGRRRLQLPALAIVLGVLVALAITTQRQTARWRGTIPIFEHSLAVAPGSVFLRNNLANELFDTGRVDESIEHYRRVLEIDPAFLVAHRNLGNALRKRGEFFEAGRHTLIGNRVEIDSLRGQLVLGDARFQEHDPAAAGVHYRRAVTLDSKSDVAHRKLAHSQLADGDLPAAIARFRELLRLGAGTSQDHILLGHALRAVGEPDAAIEHYRQAVAVAPDSAAALQILADNLQASGDLAAAIGYYRRALAAAPEDEEHRRRLEGALRLQEQGGAPADR